MPQLLPKRKAREDTVMLIPSRTRGSPPLLGGAALVLWTLLVPAQAVVRAVLDWNSSSVDFPDMPALFGEPLAQSGIRGYLMEAKPANGCHPLEKPGLPPNGSLGAIVLIQRYDCTFDLKVLHAQQAGFEAAIVHNVRSEELVRMAHVYEDLRRQIFIPSVFVGEAASQDLRGLVRCDKSAHVLLLPDYPPCPHHYCHPLLVLSWALGRALVLLASSFLVVRRLVSWLWGPGRVQMLGTAVPGVPVTTPVTTPVPATGAFLQAGQKAQVRTFTRRHDLCAICLDEYEEGDRLKILPCAHTYHCRCIDPWFSQAAQRACPVCKQAVAATEEASDSALENQATDDEGTSLPGHRPPIWAIQARLRARRLELLARTGSQGRRGDASPRAAEMPPSRAPEQL